MADTPLPKPENKWVNLFNIIADNLIKGVGADFVIAASVAYAPWLNTPGIHWLFVQLVNFLAENIDTPLKNNADIIIIRFTNNEHKGEYDDAVAKIKNPDATPAEVQAAKDALDQLIRRGTHVVWSRNSL